MRITKDLVFSVDRGTDAELAQSLSVFERDGVPPFNHFTADSAKRERWYLSTMIRNDDNAFVFGTSDWKQDTHYTPSEFLARFGSVDDAPSVITDATAVESLSVLREAMDIVGGARKAEYGDQRVNFKKYADIATLMLDSADLDALAAGRIPSAVVVKVLMAVKLGRNAFKPKRDNLVDLCGYADILHTVQGG